MQMRSFCYFRTPNAEKGNIMATTNETMKVIAEGIDQKKSPDIIMDGRVIVKRCFCFWVDGRKKRKKSNFSKG